MNLSENSISSRRAFAQCGQRGDHSSFHASNEFGSDLGRTEQRTVNPKDDIFRQQAQRERG